MGFNFPGNPFLIQRRPSHMSSYFVDYKRSSSSISRPRVSASRRRDSSLASQPLALKLVNIGSKKLVRGYWFSREIRKVTIV